MATVGLGTAHLPHSGHIPMYGMKMGTRIEAHARRSAGVDRMSTQPAARYSDGAMPDRVAKKREK